MLFETLKKAGINGFIIGILAAVLIAFSYQPAFIEDILINIKNITNIGVSVIFFFYGIGLDRKVLQSDLSNFRLHSLIQITTFLFFPLVALFIINILPTDFNPLLKTGIFFLACLPSTVSSSVVMVSISGGNITSAIFNATLSSLMGVFITPLLMSLYLHSNPQESLAITGVILQLIYQILAPLILGVLIQEKLSKLYKINKTRLKLFDQTIILLIIYQSFAESFHKQLFSDILLSNILAIGGISILLFFSTMGILKAITSYLNFDEKDYKTVLFCGSKKSLVHGTTMSKVIFSGSQFAGIYLLPIMIYHASQLIIGGFIAESMAAKLQKNKQ